MMHVYTKFQKRFIKWHEFIQKTEIKKSPRPTIQKVYKQMPQEEPAKQHDVMQIKVVLHFYHSKLFIVT